MTNNDFFNVLYERTSTHAFNPEKEISSTGYIEFLKSTAQAPSARNLQHWKKFLVSKAKMYKKDTSRLLMTKNNKYNIYAIITILGDFRGI